MSLKRKVEIAFIIISCFIVIPMIIAGFIIQVASRIGLTVAYLLWLDHASAKCVWYDLQKEIQDLWKEI